MSEKSKSSDMEICDFSIKPDDVYLAFESVLDDKGFIDHHITSANELYEIGIPQIIMQAFEINMRLDDIKRTTEEEKDIDHLQVYINFSNVVINKPTMINYNTRKEEILLPSVALLKEKTYKSVLRVDVHIKVEAIMKSGQKIVREDVVKNFKICEIPIMVKSKWCNTYGMSKEMLVQLHEDPSDPGGYFIIRGVEWVIDCVENILFNKVRIFKNEGYKKEIMRAEFISKPGDLYLNSDQFILRWLNDGQLTIEIRREKLKDIYIPFYVIFRIMGWNTDKQIFDNVLYNYDSAISKSMNEYLVDAFNAKYTHLPNARNIYTQGEVLDYFAREIKDSAFGYLDVDSYPENYQKITNFILDHTDLCFLQHIGIDNASRDKKLRFLAVLIRKMFLVKLGNMEPTDRDSYNSKRIHAAGTNYAKSFKTQFNASIIQQIKRKITKDFKSLSYSQIDLAATIKSSVYGAEFERAITQAITAGNKSQITVSKRVRINRLTSQLLNRKNQLNTYSTLRQVTATTSDSAKQSERANEMRRIHMSYLGYICIIHSPEGEKVGINKQLAIFSFVTKAGSSAVIKDILLADKEIFELNSVDYKDIDEKNLCNVYVNGDWIGCCKDAFAIATKYRKLRRGLEISPELTIVWDNTQNEVYFWIDVGRVIRPLLIVYNNVRDAEYFPKNMRNDKFRQGLKLTQSHIKKLYAKEITYEDLLKDGVIELITAEEQENMYLCPSFDTLKENEYNELYEYTHCDIPQAMIGITGLTSPYADHNQAQRIVYQTSQSKQTCGVFARNWPYRADKDTFLQYTNEMPLVKTLSSKYLYPNGSNCVVALMCYTGFNQEDSIIMNKSASDRGLFNGSKFTFYKTELEQREEFANPDITNTIDIKSACYDKLENGIIKKGTIVHKNDAIIGKIIKITKNADENFQYADRSIIYKDIEPAIVHNVIIDRNEDDEQFCKVVLRKIRTTEVGDKFCLTPDHEVLTKTGWKPIVQITKEDIVATLNYETHILEWHNPTEIHCFDHDGDMFDVSNDHVEFTVTLNHRILSFGNESILDLYKVSELLELPDFDLYKDCINILDEPSILTEKMNRTWWNNELCVLIAIYVCHRTSDDNVLTINGMAKRERISQFLKRYEIKFKIIGNNYTLMDEDVVNYLKPYGLSEDKPLPDWIFEMTSGNTRIFVYHLFQYLQKNFDNGNQRCINTDNMYLVSSIQRLSLLMMRYIHITRKDDKTFTCQYSDTMEYYAPRVKSSETKIVHYKGKVHCISVPNNTFMIRKNLKYCWTGNSSRSGQKGTIGLMLCDEDMPSTEDGIKPSIIINPHSLPSRMTIGQLIESQVGTLCAEKASQIDATMFKKIDIESIADELEKLGLNRYGYRRMYSGITGEYIDAEIFIGPTFYQRLQKFTQDTQYSISHGPSDAITRQPLSGKSSNGGLKIGEMERDVLVSHGSSRFIAEKYFNHSDGFTQHICRCGKVAIVNAEKGIYKCNYCKDNADIYAAPTSWSSSIFMKELESMNVGLRIKGQPHTYESHKDDLFTIME